MQMYDSTDESKNKAENIIDITQNKTNDIQNEKANKKVNEKPNIKPDKKANEKMNIKTNIRANMKVSENIKNIENQPEIGIISGFLGAGKTTFIKKLLEEAYADQKVCVIENESGAIGFDGAELKEKGIQVRELSDGCICCTLLLDIQFTYREIIEKINPDVILVEPSGIASINSLRSALKNVAKKDVDYVITIADASVCSDFVENMGEFYKKQLSDADCIVLSHIEECGEQARQDCIDILEKTAPLAWVTDGKWDEISSEDVLEISRKNHRVMPAEPVKKILYKNAGRWNSKEVKGILNDDYMVFSKEFTEEISREKLQKILNNIQNNEIFGTIMRVKGVIKDAGIYYRFDGITNRFYVKETIEQTMGIHIIGKQLNEEWLTKAFSWE